MNERRRDRQRKSGSKTASKQLPADASSIDCALSQPVFRRNHSNASSLYLLTLCIHKYLFQYNLQIFQTCMATRLGYTRRHNMFPAADPLPVICAIFRPLIASSCHRRHACAIARAYHQVIDRILSTKCKRSMRLTESRASKVCVSNGFSRNTETERNSNFSSKLRACISEMRLSLKWNGNENKTTKKFVCAPHRAERCVV